MADKKEELQAIIAEAQEELSKIMSAERAKANSTFVGKFYKYCNSYSAPQSDGDYWNLYVAVTGYNEYGVLAWKFEQDVYGKIEIELSGRIPSLSGGYQEITRGEFMKAWGSLLVDLNAARA